MTLEKRKKLVGPITRDPDMAEALLDAIENDNPDAEVTFEEGAAYTRIHTPGTCYLTYDSLKEALGRPFTWFEVTNTFVSFAGRMKENGEEGLIFYLEREEQ